MAESDLELSKSYGTLRHEPQPYVPSNPIHENDIERLLSVESEEMEGTWSRVKKTKDAEVWRREANEEGFPPITKAVLRLEDVPFKTAVKLMTDWKLRQEWDKTASVVDVLDRIGNFKVVYNRLKMPLFCTKRDVVLASLERYDSDQHCYILALRSTEHPLMKDSVKSNFMKLMGSAPQFIKNSYLACSPVKRMQLMRKFYLKCQTDADLNLSLSGSEKDIKMSPFISTRKTKSSTGIYFNVTVSSEVSTDIDIDIEGQSICVINSY
ncbi:hypothetical protein pdam_00010421 [Pocillopora damicornis]|uniref:START domain-containing protein n=1 Tax=Pocillopora damicornis TaxID=46731 RepID=A0A3M6U9X6_POCDA|nr:hypothetical protein pdam_00010421 [Pocillopora damicornis]